jgi:hypothetical protein
MNDCELAACCFLLIAFCFLLFTYCSKKIPPFYRGEIRSGGVGVLYFFNGSDAWVFTELDQLAFLRVGLGFSLMLLK